MADFTFGSDPEFMLMDKNGYKSAIKVLPPSSKKHKVNGNAFYYDNVLAECNIKPAESKEELIKNVNQCLKTFAEIVAPYKLIPRSFISYPLNQLNDKDALKAGCESEICFYDFKEVESPDHIIRTTTLRSAGGHIHLGSKVAEGLYGPSFVVKTLDLFLGIPSILLDKDKTSIYRKNIYGQAGRGRIKSYGVEYRTLGNFWLTSPRLVSLVYDICDFVLDFIEQERHLDWWDIDKSFESDDALNEGKDPSNWQKCHGYDVKSLRQAIDQCDIKKAKKFMEFISKHLPKSIFDDILSLSKEEKFDLYKEWNIGEKNDC